MKWHEFKQQITTRLVSGTTPFEYLTKYRCIPEPILKKYGIGVTSQREVLQIEGFEKLAGSFPTPSEENCIAFPIEDALGNPLGVELRSLRDKNYVKMYNPESKISPVFFGLTQAIDLIHKSGLVALVEGAFEVLSFATITKFPIISGLSKSLNKRQLRFLKRWTRSVILFYNCDLLGLTSARALTRFKNLHFKNSHWEKCPEVRLDTEKDLNEVFQRQGLIALRKVIEYGLKN